MHAALAELVHPILQGGIALRARLDGGAPFDSAPEIAEFKQRFAPLKPARAQEDELEEFDFDVSTDALPEESDRLSRATIRYALACWLDEFLAQYSAAGKGWHAHLMEAELYGTMEGAAKFWDEARYAETRGDLDALEVMHLCVMLGFRGTWRGRPTQLEAWAERIGALLARMTVPWTMPASLKATLPGACEPAALPVRRLAFSLLLSFSLILPAAAVLLWRHWPL